MNGQVVVRRAVRKCSRRVRGGVKAGPIQTLFRCERESRLAGSCGSRACAGRSAVPAGRGGGGHPAQLYRLHTPANPTRRACGCRWTMLAIAWADARSHAPSPVYARRGVRAVVDNLDLDVHFKVKMVRAARASPVYSFFLELRWPRLLFYSNHYG